VSLKTEAKAFGRQRITTEHEAPKLATIDPYLHHTAISRHKSLTIA